MFLFILSLLFMDSLNMIVWNIRGASNKLARVHCKELVRKFRPVFFIVVETHSLFQHLNYFGKGWGITLLV